MTFIDVILRKRTPATCTRRNFDLGQSGFGCHGHAAVTRWPERDHSAWPCFRDGKDMATLKLPLAGRDPSARGHGTQFPKSKVTSVCRLFVLGLLMILSLVNPIIAQSPSAAPATSPSPEFLRAIAPREWNFPRDHGRHDGYKTEWWYFTGNMRDQAGRRFGYQLTFFRTAYSPTATTRPSAWGLSDIYFAHAAVSDVSGKVFTFKDHLQRGRAGLAMASDQTLDVSLLDWSAKLQDGAVHLLAKEKEFSIDLTCALPRPPTLQGKGGLNAKGLQPGQASYYYSMTRLPTHGTLETAGKKFTVDGISWMDHEFSSNALGANQTGWDWISLSLADGSDLMIYRIRNQTGGSDYLSGTQISADGQPRYLSADDIQLQSSKPWKSPLSGGSYPQEWRVQVKGRAPMIVRSVMPGQELTTPHTTNVNYFEGAVDVVDEQGHSMGEGYLEMTDYLKSLGGGM